ncbi:LPXTG cell wall anchor domain-containing protein [Streptomyces sp. NPDC006923]|uniref:LPXTG cell wall anchor domain-containing protein n=1 Tax=Streptomyces sp. NPDC006923 TaxID=3155355 RepID=UPI0033E6B58A
MAVAAATAVIAPAAFFAAPAAFATDGDTTAPPTTTESAAPDASESPAGEIPETGGESTPPAPEDSAPAGEESSPGTEPAKPGPSASESAPAPSEPAPGTSESAGPGDEPTEPTDECPTDDDGVDLDSALELGIKGLPGKIVAGSGWHTFSMRATNTSDTALGTVEWALFVDNFSESDQEKDWLSTYAEIQFQDENGTWVSVSDEFGAGSYFGETELGAKTYVDLQLRVNIGAKAPAGDGYTLGLAGYADDDKDCYHTAYADWYFEVLATGSGNDNPGEAKPGKGDKPSTDTKPQGGAKELPVTGSLAETGSSSMLPVLGTAGGIAVLAGAGVVFAMKRRRDDAVA